MDKIDYKDNIITDCAINGNVDFIISRDKHLLGLREVNHKGKSIKILRTKEFLKILKRQF